MSEEYPLAPREEGGIARVQGTPEPKRAGVVSHQEASRFNLFVMWLRRVLWPFGKVSGELGRRYAEARVAKEENEAKRLVEEAAELVARGEFEHAQAGRVREATAREFNMRLKEIYDLPEEARWLAFGKLLADHPEIREQLDRLMDLIRRLRAMRGLAMEPAVEGERACAEAGEAAGQTGQTDADEEPGQLPEGL